MSKYKVPVQSLIDHIKTATDVDPWAKEMAEDLLSQPKIIRCKECKFWNNVKERTKQPSWLPCMAIQTRVDFYCEGAQGRIGGSTTTDRRDTNGSDQNGDS